MITHHARQLAAREPLAERAGRTAPRRRRRTATASTAGTAIPSLGADDVGGEPGHLGEARPGRATGPGARARAAGRARPAAATRKPAPTSRATQDRPERAQIVPAAGARHQPDPEHEAAAPALERRARCMSARLPVKGDHHHADDHHHQRDCRRPGSASSSEQRPPEHRGQRALGRGDRRDDAHLADPKPAVQHRQAAAPRRRRLAPPTPTRLAGIGRDPSIAGAASGRHARGR